MKKNEINWNVVETGVKKIVDAGLLPITTLKVITDYVAMTSEIEPKPVKKPSGLIFLGIIGSSLIGGGLIAIFAANRIWLSPNEKVFSAMLPLTISLILGLFFFKKNLFNRIPAIRDVFACFWSTSVVLSIALVARTYNLSSDGSLFCTTCALLILPIAYLLKTRSAWTIAVIFGFGSIGISIYNDSFLPLPFVNTVNILSKTIPLIIGIVLAVPFLLMTADIRRDKISFNGYVSRFLGAISLFPLVVTLFIILDESFSYRNAVFILSVFCSIAFGLAGFFERSRIPLFQTATAILLFFLTLLNLSFGKATYPSIFPTILIILSGGMLLWRRKFEQAEFFIFVLISFLTNGLDNGIRISLFSLTGFAWLFTGLYRNCRIWANIGMLWILACGYLFFMTTGLSFISKGVSMIIGGILCFVLNFFWNKWRIKSCSK